MATDYTELQTEIIDWAQKTNDADYVARVPTFIQHAEAFFNRRLRTWEMECYLPAPLAPVDATEDTIGLYDLPSDWNGHILVERDDSDNELRILYWKRIDALATATNGENWLLTKHPDLYLYQSLYAGAGYLKNDDRLQMWKDLAQEALQELALFSKGERYSGDKLIAQTPGHRPWLYKRQRDKRLKYLGSREFFDLVASDLTGAQIAHRGYFTTAAQKIRIWPKPALPA